MNEIFIARKELDACLISSAELVFVTRKSSDLLYAIRMNWTAECLVEELDRIIVQQICCSLRINSHYNSVWV